MTRADDAIVSVRIAGYTERRSIENSLAIALPLETNNSPLRP
ncbi:MAG TPA: hypothetical protein VNX23_06610 [Bradyrhizobium sp.]|jgi:hypothetical protein|nr:hypothetical protein [Bradyrhizobium sp.]HXB77070.1 hypothetical protein [Bradyrhizobium sp.]